MSKYYPKLIGERCYLSPVDPGDTGIFTTWLNDLEVTRNLTLAGFQINEAGEREALERLSREHNYSIVLKEGDRLIGNCGFMDWNQLNRTAEAGLFIGEKAEWGKGYGTEALKLLLGYGFDYLNLNSVMLRVYGFNERARGCYEKIGFKVIGSRRQALYREGKWHDEVFMDILALEFQS